MAKPLETKVCDACKQTFTFKPGMWDKAHRCPMAGNVAEGACPSCASPLEWITARYSTYRRCKAHPFDKAHRIGAPRGPAAPYASIPDAPPSFNPADLNTILVNPTPIPAAKEETPPMPATPATPIDPNSNPALAAALTLWALIKPAAAEELRAAAREEAAKVAAEHTTRPIVISVNSAPLAEIKPGGHPAVAVMARKVAAGFNNIYMAGPAGSGKTTAAHGLAESLKREFATISCSEGLSESAIVGRMVPDLTKGEDRYVPSLFVRIYRDGGVFLFDEVDAAGANVLLIINAALANGHMTLPDGSRIERNANTIIVCAANTWGTGADRQYVGRTQLDAAYLDRFVGASLFVDYDRDLEQGILPNSAMLARIWEIREKVASLKIRRVVSTRTVVAVAKLTAAGETLKQALEAITLAWTPDEKSRVGL